LIIWTTGAVVAHFNRHVGGGRSSSIGAAYAGTEAGADKAKGRDGLDQGELHFGVMVLWGGKGPERIDVER
jgi:hypothetical protein